MNHLYLFDEKGRASAYGIGTYIQNVVSACIAFNLQVTVVSVKSHGNIKIRVADNGIRYIDIPLLFDSIGNELDLEEKDNRKLYCQYIVSELEQYVSSDDSPLFHLNYTQDYFLAECLKSRWPESKIILTIHYFTWCFALQGNVTQLSAITSKNKEELTDYETKVILSGLFEQQLFELADCVICLSKFAQQVLIDYYEIPATKLILIPNGVKDRYKNLNKTILRKKYGIPENEKVLLYVGRLDRIKGVEYLIKSFNKIVQIAQNSHLYIIGDGRFGDYIPLCAPNWRHITFCGKLSTTEMDDFYQLSDIGILPSFHEQCSYVAIEMMMHGLPVIGTTSTGLDEMIKDGVNGFKIDLIELEDKIEYPVHDLNRMLLKLLQLPSLHNYTIQSRDFYMQHYTDVYIYEKLYQLYAFCFEGKEAPSQNV